MGPPDSRGPGACVAMRRVVLRAKSVSISVSFDRVTLLHWSCSCLTPCPTPPEEVADGLPIRADSPTRNHHDHSLGMTDLDRVVADPSTQLWCLGFAMCLDFLAWTMHGGS